MAKNYPKKRGTIQRSCGFLKHLSLVLVSFLVGYVFAICCDYSKVLEWVNQHVLTPSQSKPLEKPVQEAELPTPKFEFYTLLTKETNRNAVTTTSAPIISSPEAVASEPSRTQSQLSIETNASNASIDDATSANQLTHVSDEHAVQKTIEQAPLSQGSYLVQLASFKKPQDADRMKASLTMKGYIASVVAVSQQNTYWYRVVLGPFVNKSDAQRVQQTVARNERITGMVRKS